MTKHSTRYFVVLILFFTNVLTGQNILNETQHDYYLPEINSIPTPFIPKWAQLMYSNSSEVEIIMDAYEEYYSQNDFVKNQHTQFYKRLLRSHTRSTYDPFQINKSKIQDNQINYLKQRTQAINKSVNQWSVIGPVDLDLEAPATGSTPGSCHVYHLDFCEGLNQHMLAGTATAGLWKSSNGAETWELITEDLLVNEVKAASYEPMNPSLIYFSSANLFYKTINGGYDWTTTGGSAIENSSLRGKKILVNPDQITEVLFATNIGLFKSSDKGETFEMILENGILDVQYHPQNKNIIYAISGVGNRTYFHRSTDSGLTFESFEDGFPIPSSTDEQKRTQIAVSFDEPNSVYCIAVGKMNGGDGLVGIYKSENQGESWTRKCCGNNDGEPASIENTNIMEWDCAGTNNGGQYYYDLAIAVNPTNADQIITGGINVWKSEDSGTTMECISDFIYNHSPDTYVHADIHTLRYNNGNLWVASDGGIFVSSDNLLSFEKKMHGIVGTDFKGFDVGYFDKDIMLGGTYHNGTFLKEGDTYINDWVSTRSGDNSRAFVNDGDNSIIYDHSSMRQLYGDRTKIPHNIALPRKPNASFIPGESSEILFDPFHHNSLYLGQNGSLYNSQNNGVTFERVKAFGQGRVTAIEKSTTNPTLLYAVHYPSYNSPKKIMRSTDSGQSFVDVTPPSSMFNDQDLWVAMDITIGSHNPFEIWLARVPQTTSGLDLDGLQIFYSANGGDNWVNWSTPTLNGEYPTNIVHQLGSNGLVYLGTRRGVYYRSHNSTDWELLPDGLPASTYSTKLVPHYKTGLLINATSRGIYEIPFAENSSVIAIPSVDKRVSDCLRDTFYFVDRSPVDESATRIWTFNGAQTTSSTEANPKIVYDFPGQYPVSLQVSIPGSSASYTQQQFITVNDGCRIDSVVGSTLKLSGTAYAQIPSYDKVFSEMTITAWVKRQGIIYNSAGIVLHRDGPTGTGLILRSNGELSYLWDEYENDYHSGLIVPHNTWTHVAMSVTPSGINLFVNGIKASQNIPLQNVELIESFFIGGDAFSLTQHMTGSIDEIAIYDRGLSDDEIRLSMNLTHTSPLPNLISYFQANNTTGKLTDRVGHSHAFMMNSATRESSMAPVGDGCAEMHNIIYPGTYDFDCANVSLTFEADDILPMGEVSITKLHTLPDMPEPEGTQLSQNYWVVNNTGPNSIFSKPSQMLISDFGSIDSMYLNYPEIYKLYKVPISWEYGWGNPYDNGDSVYMENNTTISYKDVSGMTSSGKLIFSEEGFPALSIEKLSLEAILNQDNSRLLSWNFLPNAHEYQILRSLNGYEFIEIGKLNNLEAKNGSHFIDSEIISGQVYYKVIALQNATEVFSEIVSLQIEKSTSIRFFPTIVSTGELLHVHKSDTEKWHLNVYDLQGRKLLNKWIENQEETLVLPFDSGQYFIEFIHRDQNITGKLIVR